MCCSTYKIIDLEKKLSVLNTFDMVSLMGKKGADC